ncbi:MAG: histidine triad nucleotide-binding protein [bacterium]|nr:histidine triad nucleotide-binding protein [bacterium]
MSDCLFCKIAAKEIPTTFRHEDDEIVAFDDIHPKAPLHVLVIPKAHIPSVRELTANDAALMGRLVLVARQLAESAGIGERGYRLVINCGKEGGQVVPHLHLHLLGGKPLSGIV